MEFTNTAVRHVDATRAMQRVARVASVDVLRGVVMVLMAIDHVRVYSGVPAGGPTAGVFFTRWVTHFCAPVFVFLAGTSAFLYGRKVGDIGALSRFLLTRGALLVLLEMTLIRLSWTFNVTTLMSFQLAGVIWMLGWCMVLMSLLVRLPITALAVFGLVVIAAQDLLNLVANVTPASLQWLMQFLYTGDDVSLGPVTISVLYSIVPWIGVMAAGYAFGAILLREPAIRDRWLLRAGVAATAAFIALSATSALLAENDSGAPLLFRVLNTRKYPASPLFLMMTLGPSLLFMPFADRARGAVMPALATFGRVPMFYYLLHIPLIHALALAVWFVRDGTTHSGWFATAPYVSIAAAQRWSLLLLYAVFAVVVGLLYVACRWYDGVKARSEYPWLRLI